MTIVAYRQGIIAADTAAWSGDLFLGHTHKIARRHDGALMGGAGLISLLQATLDEFVAIDDLDDLDGPESDEIELMIAYPDGTVSDVEGDERTLLHPEFDAVGCGSEFAMGAMAAGATAEQAVAVAIERHMGCGGDVVSLTHASDKIVRKTVAEVLAEMRQ